MFNFIVKLVMTVTGLIYMFTGKPELGFLLLIYVNTMFISEDLDKLKEVKNDKKD
jgi:hypothetical protein